MTTNVQLSPEQEEFARTLVESGRYSDLSAVVRSSLELLQERETRRQAFAQMLAEVDAETERDGTVTMDEVAARMEALINSEA